MEFRPVKNAWVVVDANGEFEFRVQFADNRTYDLSDRKGDPNKRDTYCIDHGDGLVSIGIVDPETMQWWSSRASVINKLYDTKVVQISEVRTDGPYAYGYVLFVQYITLEFAEQILKQFDLPFHYIKVEDTATDYMLALRQNDMDKCIGWTRKYDHPQFGRQKVKILEYFEKKNMVHCVAIYEHLPEHIKDHMIKVTRFPRICKAITDADWRNQILDGTIQL